MRIRNSKAIYNTERWKFFKHVVVNVLLKVLFFTKSPTFDFNLAGLSLLSLNISNVKSIKSANLVQLNKDKIDKIS
jgi:hypothetical protein